MVDLTGVKPREFKAGRKTSPGRPSKDRTLEDVRRSLTKRGYSIKLDVHLADRLRYAGNGSFSQGVMLGAHLIDLLESLCPAILVEAKRYVRDLNARDPVEDEEEPI